MGISLTPEFERFVQAKIALGLYSSEEQVFQAAIEALDAQEQTISAIAEGYADFQAGRYRSLEEADADFRTRNNIQRDS
jgi:putative addiction module CopG family antidote